MQGRALSEWDGSRELGDAGSERWGKRRNLKMLGLWCQGLEPKLLPPWTPSEMTKGPEH